MTNCYGLDRYKEYWNNEAILGRGISRLAEVLESWETFRKHFELRHKLVHGRESCTKDYASTRVQTIVKAASYIYTVCGNEGVDLHAKPKTRRNSRK